MCDSKTTYQKHLICCNCGREVTFDIPKGIPWTKYCNDKISSWNQASCPNCGCNDFSDLPEMFKRFERENKPFMELKEMKRILSGVSDDGTYNPTAQIRTWF